MHACGLHSAKARSNKPSGRIMPAQAKPSNKPKASLSRSSSAYRRLTPESLPPSKKPSYILQAASAPPPKVTATAPKANKNASPRAALVRPLLPLRLGSCCCLEWCSWAFANDAYNRTFGQATPSISVFSPFETTTHPFRLCLSEKTRATQHRTMVKISSFLLFVFFLARLRKRGLPSARSRGPRTNQRRRPQRTHKRRGSRNLLPLAPLL